jgi:ABC-2 type transport system ATP-binding protein
VTVLLTTHELDEAERVADRVVIIDDGRLVAAGTTAELAAAAPAEAIRFAAPPGIDVVSLGAELRTAVEETEPGEYHVAAPPSPAAVAALTAWLAARDIPLLELRAGRQRLEDVFLRLTGRDQ